MCKVLFKVVYYFIYTVTSNVREYFFFTIPCHMQIFLILVFLIFHFGFNFHLPELSLDHNVTVDWVMQKGKALGILSSVNECLRSKIST